MEYDFPVPMKREPGDDQIIKQECTTNIKEENDPIGFVNVDTFRFTEETIKKEEVDGIKHHQCDICGAFHSSAEILVAHRYAHTLEFKYRCCVCHKTFSAKHSIKAHIFKTHMNIKWRVQSYDRCHDPEGTYQRLVDMRRCGDIRLFTDCTRLSPRQFDEVYELVRFRLERKLTRKDTIRVRMQLAIALVYLARGETFSKIARDFKAGSSTVSLLIPEVCDALWRSLQPLHLPTPDTATWLRISRQFQRKYGLPHTVGAIDAKRIEICSNDSESMERDLVVFACCDAQNRFVWTDVAAYAKEDCDCVFKRSRMGRALEGGGMGLPQEEELPGTNAPLPYFLVGGTSFRLTSHLMRPYPGRRHTAAQAVLNQRLSEAHGAIGSAFALLAARFGVFKDRFTCKIDSVEAIVKATLCLHNYLQSDSEVREVSEVSEDVPPPLPKKTSLRPFISSGARGGVRSMLQNRHDLADYLLGEVAVKLESTAALPTF